MHDFVGVSKFSCLVVPLWCQERREDEEHGMRRKEMGNISNIRKHKLNLSSQRKNGNFTKTVEETHRTQNTKLDDDKEKENEVEKKYML